MRIIILVKLRKPQHIQGVYNFKRLFMSNLKRYENQIALKGLNVFEERNIHLKVRIISLQIAIIYIYKHTTHVQIQK